jgi:hypothetical protein
MPLAFPDIINRVAAELDLDELRTACVHAK